MYIIILLHNTLEKKMFRKSFCITTLSEDENITTDIAGRIDTPPLHFHKIGLGIPFSIYLYISKDGYV